MTINPFNNNQFNKTATPREVLDFHNKDDLDSGQLAHHHTLGEGPLQAAPGNHLHDDRYITKTSYDMTDEPLGAFNPANFSSATRIRRSGNVAILHINVTALLNHGGGTAVHLIPDPYKPLALNWGPGAYYFWAADAATGTPELMYIDSSGGVYHTFARNVGEGTVGFATYIVGD